MRVLAEIRLALMPPFAAAGNGECADAGMALPLRLRPRAAQARIGPAPGLSVEPLLFCAAEAAKPMPAIYCAKPMAAMLPRRCPPCQSRATA